MGTTKQDVRSEGVSSAPLSGGSPSQISSCFGMHPTQVATWKKLLVEGAEELFADQRRKQPEGADEQDLYEQISRLQMELAWLKKKLPRSSSVKRGLIDADHPELSVRRQCELLVWNVPLSTTRRVQNRPRI